VAGPSNTPSWEVAKMRDFRYWNSDSGASQHHRLTQLAPAAIPFVVLRESTIPDVADDVVYTAEYDKA
jgi:hypothetical protein